MKRTVPGGRVDAVYTQVKTGKEIIAANAVSMNDDEDKEIIESEILEDAEESKKEELEDAEENEEE